MSVLPAFLSRNRDSIVRALTRRVAAWDSDDGRDQARAAKVLFQTGLSCATERNRTPAVQWASTLKNRSGESRKYSRALRAVQELERACRRAVLAESSKVHEAADLLEELAETADLMRLGAAVVWFGGRSKAIRTASEAVARKEAVLESSLDPIVTIDHRGVITEFNRAAEHVFKRSRNEVIGTKPSEILFPPAKIEGYQDRIDRYLDAGEGSLLGKRSEVTAVRADGTVFPAEMAMTIGREKRTPRNYLLHPRHQPAQDGGGRARAKPARVGTLEPRVGTIRLRRLARLAGTAPQNSGRSGERLERHCGTGLEETDAIAFAE